MQPSPRSRWRPAPERVARPGCANGESTWQRRASTGRWCFDTASSPWPTSAAVSSCRCRRSRLGPTRRSGCRPTARAGGRWRGGPAAPRARSGRQEGVADAEWEGTHAPAAPPGGRVSPGGGLRRPGAAADRGALRRGEGAAGLPGAAGRAGAGEGEPQGVGPPGAGAAGSPRPGCGAGAAARPRQAVRSRLDGPPLPAGARGRVERAALRVRRIRYRDRVRVRLREGDTHHQGFRRSHGPDGAQTACTQAEVPLPRTWTA